MASTAQLIWGMVFSTLGLGYFVYGRKQRNPVPLAVGLALMVYPFFVGNAYLIVLIGVVLCAVPYFIRY